LIAGHGIHPGPTIDDAERHVEILEFLLRYMALVKIPAEQRD
jgi:hypothetical protein